VSSKKTLVFFMNPSGKPCGIQNEILQKLLKDRNNNFNLAYVDATKPADQKAFYDYGIRSMPALVLVDANGNIGRVFPPGIQSYETVSQALDSVK
jgi:thioredoxin 1